MQRSRTRSRFEVTRDGEGIVSHTGAALLVELADRLGLTAALSWRAGRRQTVRHRHNAGMVLRDLAVLLADGGDCLSDLAVLRDQPELFGEVASTATAWRVINQVACDELGLAGIRAAHAHARGRAWAAGAHPDANLLLVEVDGTLLEAHSDKQGAAGTYKHGYGFYPLVCFLDRGDGTGEALAGLLRPGNAGSNTAADHIEVTDLALAQLPCATRDQPVVVRADTGGATHAFTDHLRQQGVGFSISLPTDERVRAAVLAVPAAAWRPAIDPGGQPRAGAEVAELATLDLAGWPPGTRAICRREDPHPGAQLSFTDADGHRFQVFLTDQPDPDLATLELRHRQRARVEDRIRIGKATGLRNLPFDLLRRNAVWLELVLMACDLTCWTQILLLDGDLRVAEPKALRYRLLHVAARVVRHARRLIVRLQRSWPWVAELALAFQRLRRCRYAADRLPRRRRCYRSAASRREHQMRATRKRMIRRLLIEIEQANEARFRAAPFPLYGLPPSVAGPRMIAGSHPSDRTGHPTDPGDGLQLELVHGDPTVRPPSLLRVATTASPAPSQQLVPLRQLLWQEVVADRLAARSRHWRIGWFKAAEEHTVGGSQQLLTIPVDGQPRQFALLQEGLAQAARVELSGHVVTVRARRWPIQTVELVQVTDLAPYLDGRRQLLARLITKLQ